MSAGQSHITSIVVERPARQVFAFMADPAKLHRWSFGTWETEIADDGLVTGTSIFDGARILVRIDADRGATVDRLQARQRSGKRWCRASRCGSCRARISGSMPEHCVLTFIAWRAAAMDDDRWRRLTASHEFEVVLLKNLIENEGFIPSPLVGEGGTADVPGIG